MTALDPRSAPSLHAEARALRWLSGVFILGLVLSAAHSLSLAAVGPEDFPWELVAPVWPFFQLLVLGGVASWASSSSGSTLARVAVVMFAIEWAWWVLSGTGLFFDLLDHSEDAIAISTWIHVVLASLTNLSLVFAVGLMPSPRRGPVDLWLPVGLAVYIVALAIARRTMELESGTAEALQLTTGAVEVGLWVWLFLRRRAHALTDAEDAPASEPGDAGRWQRALAGAQLVRKAEVTRVVVLISLVLLGVVAAGARSGDLLLFLFMGAAIMAVVIQGIQLAGLAAFRHVPAAGGGSGPAAAAFVFAIIGVVFTALAMIVLVVGFLERDSQLAGADGAFGHFEVASVMVGFAAVVCLLWAIRRVGHALGAQPPVARATAAVVLYVVAGVVTVISKLPPIADQLMEHSGGIIVGLAIVGLAIAGLALLIQALTAVSTALEEKAWVTPFED